MAKLYFLLLLSLVLAHATARNIPNANTGALAPVENTYAVAAAPAAAVGDQKNFMLGGWGGIGGFVGVLPVFGGVGDTGGLGGVGNVGGVGLGGGGLGGGGGGVGGIIP